MEVEVPDLRADGGWDGRAVSMDKVPRDSVVFPHPGIRWRGGQAIASDPRYSLSFAKPKVSDKDDFIA